MMYVLFQTIKMESRLANIVHHISGEADEDTMSAWESLNGGGGGGGGLGSPAEMGPAHSLRRRSSFGLQMASFSENPMVEPRSDQVTLESELAEVGRGGLENDEIRPAIRDVVQRTKEAAGVEEGEGAGVVTATAESIPIDGGEKGGTKKAQVGDETASAGHSAEMDLEPRDDNDYATPPAAAMPHAGNNEGTEVVRVPTVALVQNATTDEATNGLSVEATAAAAAAEEKPPGKILAASGGGGGEINDPRQRRRSNQDDQSDGSNSKLNSARDSSINGGNFQGKGACPEEGSVDYPPSAFNPQGSIESAESDARYCLWTPVV